MSETNHSNAGWFRITSQSKPFRGRVVVFVLAVVLGVVGIAWIHSNLGRSMHQLEEGFAAIKTERFYHGVYLRLSLRQLNQTLLEYHLGGNKEDLVRFLEDARQFKGRMEAVGSALETPGETIIYGKLGEAYEEYLRQTDYLQDRSGLFGPSRRKVG